MSAQQQKAATEEILARLKDKPIQWDVITARLTAGAVVAPSLWQQVLTRACTDSSVNSSTMKKLLRSYPAIIEIEERAKLVLACVRCHNLVAAQALVENDPHVVRWQEVTRSRNTILHLSTERYGWNEVIEYVFEATLEQTTRGIFQPNNKGKSPLRFALEAGATLAEILLYLRQHSRTYFEANVWRLPAFIAEFCEDMSLLEELCIEFPNLIVQTTTDDTGESETPLHKACYYQNQAMIQFILNSFVQRGERKRKIVGHLLLPNRSGISPLGYLILGLGSRDAANTFDCVKLCLESVRGGSINLLHYTLDKLWKPLLEKQRLLRTLKRIEDELPKQTLSSLHHGKSLLVVVIQKMAEYNCAEAREVLQYILNNNNNNNNAATTQVSRPDKTKRLPLHYGCELGLEWEDGLRQLVDADVSALGVPHPKSGLLPFAVLTAAGSSSGSNNNNNNASSSVSLTSIYEILRYNPGFL